MDSDDTIESEHFKNLMEHADKVDWVQTGDKDIDLEGKVIRESKVNEIIADSSEGINDNIIMLPNFGHVTNKIFNSDILKKNNIQFRPWLSLQEDKVFVFDYLKCSNSFIILPYSTYHYRYNVGSLSKRKYYVPSVFLNLAEALDTYVNDDSFGIKTHEYIAQFVSKLYFRAFCSCFNPISKLGYEKRLKSAHCIVKSFLNSRLIKVYGLGTTKYLFWVFKYYAIKIIIVTRRLAGKK